MSLGHGTAHFCTLAASSRTTVIGFAMPSVAVEDQDGKLLGVLPAAVDPSGERRVVSHPGLTYGGMVHAGELSGGTMLTALTAATNYYFQSGFTDLRYKAVPSIYHAVPSQDDIYALFRLQASQPLCTLSSVIDLSDPPSMSTLRRRQIKKSQKNGVEVLEGADYLCSYWPILEEVLGGRHGVKRAHSLGEIRHLAELFPENVLCIVARLDGETVVGTVVFRNARVDHTQYLASGPVGREIGALDAVIQRVIENAAAQGRRYVSFGISN